MQDQVASVLYKYINDFDFNITKLKTYGQIPESFKVIYSSYLNIQTTITIKVLTENKQIFYSKLKYATITGYVKLKILRQLCFCKIMRHNVC
jgi:hypothetical protein